MPQRTILMRLRHLIEQVPDAVGVSVSTNTTWVAGGTGIASALMQLNWTAIIASTVAILGLVMNFYFNKRREQRDRLMSEREIAAAHARELREQELHQAELMRIRGRCDE